MKYVTYSFWRNYTLILNNSVLTSNYEQVSVLSSTSTTNNWVVFIAFLVGLFRFPCPIPLSLHNTQI
jgi:hypothetical protein